MIKIGNYDFEGPFDNLNFVKNTSGIYAILCSNGINNYNLIDIGESSELNSRLSSHDRKDCWEKNCNTKLFVAVFYTSNMNENQRRQIEAALRLQFKPPCGTR